MLRSCLLALLLLAGCERKAPGPAECQRFATAALQRAALRGEPLPILRAKYGELVRECLTTPLDRRMVTCVEHTGSYGECRLAFEMRRRLR